MQLQTPVTLIKDCDTQGKVMTHILFGNAENKFLWKHKHVCVCGSTNYTTKLSVSDIATDGA